MTTSELSLLDTNILIYAADENSPHHQASMALREKGLRGEISLCICPQILNEFFAIVTDQRRANNPRTQSEALLEIEKYFHSQNIFKIYPGPDIIEKTIELLRRYEISRQKIFDLQLVATMFSNNVKHLYTYNQGDFSQFNEVEVLTP